MNEAFLKQKKSKNILIYAQSGILAGDLAALLSGQNTVDRQTSLPGVLKSLNSKTDVLLLVGAKFEQKQAADPSATLAKAEVCNCRVIVLGDWPGDWQKQLGNNRKSSVTVLAEIPSPAALFDIIGVTSEG